MADVFLDVHHLGLWMNTSEADEVHPVKDDLFHQSNLHLPRDVRMVFLMRMAYPSNNIGSISDLLR